MDIEQQPVATIKFYDVDGMWRAVSDPPFAELCARKINTVAGLTPAEERCAQAMFFLFRITQLKRGETDIIIPTVEV